MVLRRHDAADKHYGVLRALPLQRRAKASAITLAPGVGSLTREDCGRATGAVIEAC